jgi:hypothetical protein
MVGDESLEEPRDPTPAGTFILKLRLGPGEPLIGSISSAGDVAPVTFRGWLDFMSVVDRLRTTSAHPGP